MIFAFIICQKIKAFSGIFIWQNINLLSSLHCRCHQVGKVCERIKLIIASTKERVEVILSLHIYLCLNPFDFFILQRHQSMKSKVNRCHIKHSCLYKNLFLSRWKLDSICLVSIHKVSEKSLISWEPIMYEMLPLPGRVSW